MDLLDWLVTFAQYVFTMYLLFAGIYEAVYLGPRQPVAPWAAFGLGFPADLLVCTAFNIFILLISVHELSEHNVRLDIQRSAKPAKLAASD